MVEKITAPGGTSKQLIKQDTTEADLNAELDIMEQDPLEFI